MRKHMKYIEILKVNTLMIMMMIMMMMMMMSNLKQINVVWDPKIIDFFQVQR